jgi:hypothetical protein
MVLFEYELIIKLILIVILFDFYGFWDIICTADLDLPIKAAYNFVKIHLFGQNLKSVDKISV